MKYVEVISDTGSADTILAISEKVQAQDFRLVILSTVVATIGLIEDNIAVVIGAMVIAPLLRPNQHLVESRERAVRFRSRCMS